MPRSFLRRLTRDLAPRRALGGVARTWPNGLDGAWSRADGHPLDPLSAHLRIPRPLRARTLLAVAEAACALLPGFGLAMA